MLEPEVGRTHHKEDLNEHDGGDEESDRQIADELSLERGYLHVEHHHHEEEENHHGPHVDQHQHNGEKLGLQQHPQTGACNEGQHHVEHRMHRIPPCDHHAGRRDGYGGEDVEQKLFKAHDSSQDSR